MLVSLFHYYIVYIRPFGLSGTKKINSDSDPPKKPKNGEKKMQNSLNPFFEDFGPCRQKKQTR